MAPSAASPTSEAAERRETRPNLSNRIAGRSRVCVRHWQGGLPQQRLCAPREMSLNSASSIFFRTPSSICNMRCLHALPGENALSREHHPHTGARTLWCLRRADGLGRLDAVGRAGGWVACGNTMAPGWLRSFGGHRRAGAMVTQWPVKWVQTGMATSGISPLDVLPPMRGSCMALLVGRGPTQRRASCKLNK